MMLNKAVYIINSYPSVENEKEGKQQRVKAIDALFKNTARCYINLTVRGNFLPSISRYENGKVEELSLNFFLYSLFVSIFLAFRKPLIYVHSVFESVKILPVFLFSNKVIVDLHGVVPEELIVLGKPIKSEIYGFVERVSILKSHKNIVVTNKMKHHFIEKYGASEEHFIVVPIFSILNNPAIEKGADLTAIYAGGMQEWQCIDKMAAFIRGNPSIKYKLFFPNPDKFTENYGDISRMSNVLVSTATPEDIAKEYNGAHFGLIIRDDIVLNRVACPTKLIEYINSNLIPVVGDCSIGDFEELGMKSVHYQSFDIESIDALSHDSKVLRDNLINLHIKGKHELMNLIKTVIQ